MARRRLESAIQAGKYIAEGKEYPDKFTSIKVEHNVNLEKELEGVFSLQYSFDAKFLAVGCGNGTIRLYETSTGKKVSDLRWSRYGGLPVMCLRFHPKKQTLLLAGTSAGYIYQCDIADFYADGASANNEERFKELIREDRNEINCLDFDYTYSSFATGGKDLNIRIYDANTFQLRHVYEGYSTKKNPTEIQTAGCAGRIFALKYHPLYDDIFITGGWDNHLKIWDARSNDGVKRTIWGPHICGDALDLRDYDILTGSWTGKDALQIWDYTEGKVKKNVNFPSESGPMLYCCQFCDNDTVIAGGSGTNSAKAINTKTNQVLGEVKFEKPIHAMDSTMGGRLFTVGDGGHCLKMCRLTNE
ncbi:hypothetical protein ACJMK2_034680 [Sinanodonta woodiana]|uniref:Anaphase-promoting complex subunit 4-like WD40 domain-containing protein n=1 Tax=Sinanodonta woodiana TaxID=1069815 RepID=A0ABD3WSG2_SINWO